MPETGRADAPARVTPMRASAAARLREHLIAALARRAGTQQGAAREALEARLAQLRASTADETTPASAEAPHPARPAAAGPLARLLSELEREGRVRRPEAPSGESAAVPRPAPSSPRAVPAGHPAAPRPPRPGRPPRTPAPVEPPLVPALAPAPEPEALQYFRRTWSRLSAEQRVAQSQSALPGNAGPLHSQQLLHRALLLMRDVSPDYLERFIVQVDALLWLESANAQIAAGPAPAPAKSAAERRVARPRG